MGLESIEITNPSRHLDCSITLNAEADEVCFLNYACVEDANDYNEVDCIVGECAIGGGDTATPLYFALIQQDGYPIIQQDGLSIILN